MNVVNEAEVLSKLFWPRILANNPFMILSLASPQLRTARTAFPWKLLRDHPRHKVSWLSCARITNHDVYDRNLRKGQALWKGNSITHEEVER